MKLTLLSVGKIKRGPERELVDDYLLRARKAGAQLGFREIIEIEVESGGGFEREGNRLLAAVPENVSPIRLDERGKAMRSKAFANMLASRRDEGQDICFMIGGAEGYSSAVVQAAPDTLALGPQTWPHRLVRVMLAEQIYRAISILAGTPYHKD